MAAVTAPSDWHLFTHNSGSRPHIATTIAPLRQGKHERQAVAARHQIWHLVWLVASHGLERSTTESDSAAAGRTRSLFTLLSGDWLGFSKWLGIYPRWGAIILRVAIAGRATEETMSSRKAEKDGSRDTKTMNPIDAAIALGRGKGAIVGVPGHQTREIAAQDRGTERDETETATTAGAVRGVAGETTSTTTGARDRSRDATPRTRRDPKEAGA